MGRKDSQPQEGLSAQMRRERQKRGVSLTQFAEKIGYTKSYLSRIETGTNPPSEDVLSKYEQVMGLAPGYFKKNMSVKTEKVDVREGAPRDSAHFQDTYITSVLAAGIVASQHRVFILDNWLFKRPETFKDSFRQALSRSVDVRIILLDPTSPCADLRSQDLEEFKDDRQGAAKVIIKNLLALHEWSQEADFHAMKVKVHKRLPSVLLYIIDNHATLGFYFHKSPSRHGPHLEIELSELTTMEGHIEAEFEFMWSNSTPLDKYMLDAGNMIYNKEMHLHND